MISLNSVCNEEIIILYFFNLMGIWLKRVVINKGVTDQDLRIPISIFQTSRSGKGMINKVYEIVCKELGILCKTVTKFTPEGLIGTIDYENFKYNQQYLQYGLSKENPEIDNPKKGKNQPDKVYWRNPIIFGDFGNYEILIFDEYKKLLNPRYEDLLLDLQPALDYPPHISVKYKHPVPIEYSNSITIVGTGIVFKELNNVLAELGFLQRSSVIIKSLSLEEIQKMRDEELKLQQKDVKKEFNSKLKIFKERLLNISREKKVLFLNKGSGDKLKKISDELFKEIGELRGADRDVALSFTNTIETTLTKIAGIYAIINDKSNIIKSHNVEQANLEVKPFKDTLINKIIIRDKETEIETNKYLNILKKEFKDRGIDKLNQRDCINILVDFFGNGYNRNRKIFLQLISGGYIEIEKGEKNEKFYKIAK